MKALKKIVSLLLAAATVTALSSCQSKTKNENASNGGGNDQKQITLSFSNDYTAQNRASDENSKLFYEMLDEFKKDNPNVKFDISEISQDNYSTKIQAQNTASDLPDLFFLKGSWVKSFVKTDSLAPLTNALNQSGIKDKYRTGIFSPVTVSGNIYAMPIQYSVSSMVFYNSNMWKSIGFDKFPDNWNDILSAPEKFKAKGIKTTIALGNKDKWPYESTILSCLGDRFTGSEWTNNIIERNGKSKFTDSSFVKALEFSQKLAKFNLFNPDYNSITDDQATTYYCQGNAASTIDGMWDVSYININATDEVKKATKIALLPAVEGGKGKADSTSGGAGWFIAANSKLKGEKLNAAEKFIMYVTGEKYSKDLAEKYGLVGSVNVGKADTSKFSNVTQEYVNLVNSGIALTPIYDIQMNSNVIDVLNTGLQGLLNGSQTPSNLAQLLQNVQEKAKSSD
jgi:raffinose/stachyose/melibiose transport system substrate-binding protein